MVLHPSDSMSGMCLICAFVYYHTINQRGRRVVEGEALVALSNKMPLSKVEISLKLHYFYLELGILTSSYSKRFEPAH